jgi:branched-chain amino acid transport system substrate-binding protein
MRQRIARRWTAGMIVAVACAAFAGCGSDDNNDAATTATGAAPTTTAAAAPAEAGVSDAAKSWAVDYTGGTAGAADASKPPVKIGYINQQGGASGFEGSTIGYTAIKDFVNKYVGGVQGRPLAYDSCYVQSEEDGQKCGAQFLTSGVQLVVTGQLVLGSTAFYKTLGGKIPVINSSPGSAPDLTSPNVYGTTAGALQLSAMGQLITQKIKPKTVAVIYQNDPVGSFIAQKLLKPQLDAAKMKSKLVPFELTATTPDMASALQAADASSSDLVVGIATGPPCQAFAQAYKQLGLKTKVVTESDCYGVQTTEAIGGEWPAGWFFASNQAYDPHIPDAASGTDTYLAAMNATAQGRTWVYDPHAAYTLGAGMLAVKLLNQEGADAKAAALSSALKSYNGPIGMNEGNFECGKVKTAPNVCNYYVSFVESAAGKKWLPTYNGAAAFNVAPPSGG